MKFKAQRFIKGFVLSLLAMTLWWGPNTALAVTNDVTAIACPTSVHVADFVGCVRQFLSANNRTGLFLAASPTQALTALVRVAGTFQYSCNPTTGNCHYIFSGTLSPVKPDGTALTTDADLVTTDKVYFGNFRTSGALGKVIKIPPTYGTTPVGNEAFDVDTNTGINVALAQLGINPATVPGLTVITVTWQDGSTAQFVRTNSVPSLLWKYVPGSAKDKNGNPLDITSGALLKNPHSGGTGSGVVIPASPWYLELDGGSSCSGTTVTTIEGVDYTFEFFYPC